MKDVQKPDHKSLKSIINLLKEGRFVIPDFQRAFEWEPWDITELIKSIFLDYYIGSLLLWKGRRENFNALSCETIHGFNNFDGVSHWNTLGGNPEYVVLDGQQRLTAIYYAIVAPEVCLPNRKRKAVYYINVDKFMNDEADDAFHYEWLSKKFKRLLSDKEQQFEEHIFPLSVIGCDDGWELFEWIRGYENYWKSRLESGESEQDIEKTKSYKQNYSNAKTFGSYVRDIITEYQIAYIELDAELAIDKVCDIFTKINSRGTRLDVFDLMNALLKPKGLQLKHMWRDTAPKLDFIETDKMNIYILQVMSILKQAYCSPKYLFYLLPGQRKQIREPDGTMGYEVLINDIEEFEELWNRSVELIKDAILLLQHPQEYGVTSSQYMPYVSILPAFSAMQHALTEIPAERRLEAQKKIRQWYWASVFTNRYSGAVASTTTRDYLDMKSWFENSKELPVISELRYRCSKLDLLEETKKGSSLYNGIFNLFVINGARDWISGSIPQNSDMDDHHIVPDSWGKENLEGIKHHSILNRTPLTSDTNRNLIRKRLPNEYLPELIRQNGEDEVKSILEGHFIDNDCFNILLRKPFTEADFDDFVGKRGDNILHAIRNLIK